MSERKKLVFGIIFIIIFIIVTFLCVRILNKRFNDKIEELDTNTQEEEIQINNQINNSSENINFEKNFNESVNNLDETLFLVDAENYMPQSNEIKTTENKAKEIAQKGFEESAKRIAGEGAENKETETVRIEEMSPNNYFTRYYYEGDKIYNNIKRKCYVVSRENDMGNGISIYIDVTTGLIIGGEAFGD